MKGSLAALMVKHWEEGVHKKWGGKGTVGFGEIGAMVFVMT